MFVLMSDQKIRLRADGDRTPYIALNVYDVYYQNGLISSSLHQIHKYVKAPFIYIYIYIYIYIFIYIYITYCYSWANFL